MLLKGKYLSAINLNKDKATREAMIFKVVLFGLSKV